MIGEDTDWMSSTCEIMSPFLERRYPGKHLFVMNFIVDLSFVHLSRVVHYRVQSSINDLGEYCADSEIDCVSLAHHRPNRFEVSEYGSLGKVLL
jgi:hypothetical protein